MMSLEVSDHFSALAALGAGDFVHMNGSLDRHFIAVHDLLQSWGAHETLCRAGLYHAAYGTAGFTEVMVSSSRRSEIVGPIGVDAEQIVYQYCSCDREFVWPQIGSEDPVRFRDRFTDSEYEISGPGLSAFCELTCANEIEIAIEDKSFADRAGDYLGNLFMG